MRLSGGGGGVGCDLCEVPLSPVAVRRKSCIYRRYITSFDDSSGRRGQRLVSSEGEG
jgi:hypothetical protein